MLDPVVIDERRFQSMLERDEKRTKAAEERAELFMQKGERYYPYAIGNMEDALNDISHVVLEKLGEALGEGDELLAGMILGLWCKVYVKPLAVELAMDKIELWEL